MKTINLAAAAVFLSTVVASAQTLDTHGGTSSIANPGYSGGAPGTVGALAGVAQDIATSPEDVVLQQQGRGTAAQGARLIQPVEAGYAPGTVGAAPGSDAGR